jgi:predicted phage terminase large subunit-like protein
MSLPLQLINGDALRPRAEITILEVQKYLTEVAAEERRRSLRVFAQRAWSQIQPERAIWNWHMDAICDHLAYLSMREIRFLMVNVPFRSSKTMLCSVIWPAWHWLHEPGEQFLCASVDDKLAKDAAILSRRLIEGRWYQDQWPGEIELFSDENRVDMYRNTKGGYRELASLQTRTTGMGGTTQMLDDPHDAKKVESDAVRHGALTWHDNTWRSRVNDWNRLRRLYLGQRTHDMDIFGHILAQEAKRWCVLKIPLEFNPKKRCITFKNKGQGPIEAEGPIFKDPRVLENELMDPKRMNAETVNAEKAVWTERAWMAQANQEPVGEGGLILKRHWWRPWVEPEWRANPGRERPMPRFDEIIQVWDTALEEDEEADYSARTTWGLFTYTEQYLDPNLGRPVTGQTRTCAMLIDALEERLTYPDLREEAIRACHDFDPNWVLIEKKVSGHSLVQELRKKRLPIKAVKLAGSSGKGKGSGDLVARAHSASLMLEKGCIFYPPRQFAYAVIDECSKFPNGDHDDFVSTVCIALMYMRRYHDLELPDDEKDEISPWAWKRRAVKKRYG